MDPATLTAIGTLVGGIGSAATLLSPKPKAPKPPHPAQPVIPDTNPAQSTSFLSNAAVAPSMGQSGGKTLLGQ